MYLAMLYVPAVFLSACSALPGATFVNPSVPSDVVARCRDFKSKINPSCWNTFGMDAYMRYWKRTTTTCTKNEVWANCFMRQVKSQEIDSLGCAQLGPNTCPEPDQVFNITNGSAETFYGAYSIWCKLWTILLLVLEDRLISSSALQQYMTNLYDSFESENGSDIVRESYEKFEPPVKKTLIIRKLSS